MGRPIMLHFLNLRKNKRSVFLKFNILIIYKLCGYPILKAVFLFCSYDILTSSCDFEYLSSLPSPPPSGEVNTVHDKSA